MVWDAVGDHTRLCIAESAGVCGSAFCRSSIPSSPVHVPLPLRSRDSPPPHFHGPHHRSTLAHHQLGSTSNTEGQVQVVQGTVYTEGSILRTITVGTGLTTTREAMLGAILRSILDFPIKATALNTSKYLVFAPPQHFPESNFKWEGVHAFVCS